MMRGLVELAKTAGDERVRSVCLIAMLGRAGVEPIDYDSAEEAANRKPTFGPSLFTTAELEQMPLIAERQGLVPRGAAETISTDQQEPRAG
jgi:hypothetical protein